MVSCSTPPILQAARVRNAAALRTMVMRVGLKRPRVRNILQSKRVTVTMAVPMLAAEVMTAERRRPFICSIYPV